LPPALAAARLQQRSAPPAGQGAVRGQCCRSSRGRAAVKNGPS